MTPFNPFAPYEPYEPQGIYELPSTPQPEIDHVGLRNGLLITVAIVSGLAMLGCAAGCGSFRLFLAVTVIFTVAARALWRAGIREGRF
jgi:hypothetical protein